MNFVLFLSEYNASVCKKSCEAPLPFQIWVEWVQEILEVIILRLWGSIQSNIEQLGLDKPKWLFFSSLFSYWTEIWQSWKIVTFQEPIGENLLKVFPRIDMTNRLSVSTQEFLSIHSPNGETEDRNIVKDPHLCCSHGHVVRWI